jgi:hypothetical protein
MAEGENKPWNTAAARVLTDYGQLPLAERNVLRRLFTRPEARPFA